MCHNFEVIEMFIFVGSAAKGNALQARTKLLASLTSQFGGELKNCKFYTKILIIYK